MANYILFFVILLIVVSFGRKRSRYIKLCVDTLVRRLKMSLVWVGKHWEFIFLIPTVWLTSIALANPESGTTIGAICLFLVIPSPVILLWVVVLSVVGRVQIVARFAGWVAYWGVMGLLLGKNPSSSTLTVLTEIRKTEGEILMWVVVGILVITPFIMIAWTRNARLHPKSHEWDFRQSPG